MSDPFEFIKRLPEAAYTGRHEKHPGVFISAALVEGKGRNIVFERIDGPKVPAPVYTMNIGGRGSLVFNEQDFRDLLSAGLLMFEVNSPGFVAPNTTKPSLPDVSSLTGDSVA